jgi:hypothetical protein
MSNPNVPIAEAALAPQGLSGEALPQPLSLEAPASESSSDPSLPPTQVASRLPQRKTREPQFHLHSDAALLAHCQQVHVATVGRGHLGVNGVSLSLEVLFQMGVEFSLAAEAGFGHPGPV